MANPIVQKITAELESLQKELTQFRNTTDYLVGAKQNVENAVKSIDQAEVNFEKRITDLKETYDAITSLQEVVNKVISKIDKIDFPERLDSIELTVMDTIDILNKTRKATLDELQKASEVITKADFDGRFQKLQQTIDESVQANEKIVEIILKEDLGGKIKSGLNDLEKKIQKELKRIETSTNHSLAENEKFIQDLNLPVRMDKLDANIAGIMGAVQNTQNRIETLDRNIGEKIKEAHVQQAHALSNLQMQFQQNNDALNKRVKSNTYFTWGIIIIAAILNLVLLKII